VAKTEDNVVAKAIKLETFINILYSMGIKNLFFPDLKSKYCFWESQR
jgi:hypothetical protein